MKILIVSATAAEVAPLLSQQPVEHSKLNSKISSFKYGSNSVDVMITGAGMFATAYEMGSWLARRYYDLILGVGIAGSFNKRTQIGSVVQVQSEQLGDLGIEEDDGFRPISQLHFFDPDAFPFSGAQLHSDRFRPTLRSLQQIPLCSGVSVNCSSGRASTIRQIVRIFRPDIETMENAGFFYACLSVRQPRFVALRAISNIIDLRSKQEWDIPLAVNELHKVICSVLDECDKVKQL